MARVILKCSHSSALICGGRLREISETGKRLAMEVPVLGLD